MTNVNTITQDVVNKIDLCRGVFAILVVIAHALDVATVSRSSSIESTENIFRYVFGHGFYWVMGFFVISGFCIQLSVQKINNNTSFSLKYYMIARLTRILPLYFIALILALLVEFIVRNNRVDYWNQGIHLSGLISQIFVIQNLTETYGCYAPSWSITNEICYYALHGIFLTVFHRSKIPVPLFGLIFCLLGSCAFLYSYTLTDYKFLFNVFLLLLLGSVWYCGVVVAFYHQKILQIYFIRIISNYWLAMLLIVLIVDYYRMLHPQLRNLSLWIVFSAMLLSFIHHSNPRSYFCRKTVLTNFCKELGISSYPIYLIHGSLIILLASNIVFDSWLKAWLLFSLTSVICGWLAKDILEKPVMNWKSNVLRQFI
ncbi:MAG: acyltransferase family protein [Nostoc sp.]